LPPPRARDLLFGALAALAVFVSHALSPVGLSGDSRWSVPGILAILDSGSPELSRYADLLRAEHYYAIECVRPDFVVVPADAGRGCPPGSRVYSRYPVASYLLAIPPFLALDRMPWNPLKSSYLNKRAAVEVLLASFLIAAAAFFVYLAARRELPVSLSFALVGIFAFCTPAWSTGSRSLMQHTSSMLLLAAALYWVPRNPAPAGLALGLAFWCRPTNLLALLLLGGYLARRDRSQAVRYGIAAGLVFAAGAALCYPAWHALTPPYFRQSGVFAVSSETLAALAGNWLSPSRGLLVFCPVFLLCVPGWREIARRDGPLAAALAALIVSHWILISLYTDWTGGYSYGPRYFSDLVPVFVYLLIPVLRDWPRRRWLLLSLAALSFAIHFRGAFHLSVHEWNKTPVSIDGDRMRAWDLTDPQFLR
jgi:hypothetical protein